ncbi:MAG: hypothetical protein IJV40_15455 [Oscillospiraceae bacterium]|nr:hypothetical protein [Oscillospiraceae bacterium]
MSQQEEKKIGKKRYELEMAGPFLVVLAVMTLIAFLIPLRPAASVREKRTLREFPTFSVDALLSGDYFDDIGMWFSDTFPGRETMLEISERMDALHGLGKNEIALNQTNAANDNDELDALLEQAEAEAAARREAEERAAAEAAEAAAIVAEAAKPADPDAVIEDWGGLAGEDEAGIYGDLVVIDGTILSRLGFDQSASDHHAALMNKAGDALAAKGIRFFNLPAPTSISVLISSELLSELGSADQGKTLRYMFAQENDNVHKVNAFNNMLKHNTEYIYFNTDHHWTALGAYYAYQAFCEEAGFEPVPLDEFTEWNMGEFEGTYTHSVNSRNLKADEVIALVPPGNENIHMEIAGYPHYTTVIVDESEAAPNMKYNCFIAGDNPITILTNDNLPDAPDCMVIKDSYGNPFTVYLTQHYHKVYILDYRKNFTPVSIVAEQYGVQDVILAQSIGVSQTRQAQSLLDNLMK